jgi:hypothetical protein
MIRGDALRRGCIVIVLRDSMLCEGVKGVDRTASMGPKAMPFDWGQ